MYMYLRDMFFKLDKNFNALFLYLLLVWKSILTLSCERHCQTGRFTITISAPVKGMKYSSKGR